MTLSENTTKELAEKAGLLNPKLRQLLPGKTLGVRERNSALQIIGLSEKKPHRGVACFSVGTKFNRLTVKHVSDIRIGRNGSLPRREIWYLCSCDCGNEISVRHRVLARGQIACGCVSGSIPKHGHGNPRSSEYKAWRGMKERCLNKSNRHYKDYGGRGIMVCERWLNSFLNFLEDMGPRPNKDYMLDRIDNNRGYSPDNCRWTDNITQQRNKRNNHIVNYEGSDMCLQELVEVAKPVVSMGGLQWRLRHGWPLDKALTIPPRPRFGTHKLWAKMIQGAGCPLLRRLND